MPLPVGPHPRSRGENNRRRVVAWARPGSSPLTRGKPTVTVGRRVTAGLIPARAGKTSTETPQYPSWWAHPHSRGENRVFPSRNECTSGSSPLTRGKRQVLGRSRQVRQLIPAHAGKTLHNPAHRSASKAHPRSRGENFKDETRGVWGEGSSPLTRGKHVHERGRPDEGGLIPAHAGKTCPRIRRAWAAPAHPHSRWENS